VEPKRGYTLRGEILKEEEKKKRGKREIRIEKGGGGGGRRYKGFSSLLLFLHFFSFYSFIPLQKKSIHHVLHLVVYKKDQVEYVNTPYK
jgi:hypothetical protein